MGNVILFLLVAVEAFLMVWALVKRERHVKERSIIRIGEFALLAVFLLTGVLEWGFRYYAIALVLFIQAIAAAASLIRKQAKEKPFRIGKTIGNFVGKIFLYCMALLLAIICPQTRPIQPDGEKAVAHRKYTWTDEERIETFAVEKEGEDTPYRKLTVEFWYPDEEPDETYPLIVFSHGAFGFSGCNLSTFEQLASHGYVVASVGHTYHAFFTLDTDGVFTPANMDFINSIYAINASEDEELIYYTTQEWLKLRVDDEDFVLDTILQLAVEDSGVPFTQVDTTKIGLFGHSLGGASSAALGRMREDIGAVIDLDGSMFGEAVGFEDGFPILSEEPYPVPLLNIYAEDHYVEAKKLVEKIGEKYYNFYATDQAIEAYAVVFMNAGHLNFTDLPLFSPFLARILGVGEIDAFYGVEKMNEVVLEFFDSILKNGTKPVLEREY